MKPTTKQNNNKK